jgi:hypothetical protein
VQRPMRLLVPVGRVTTARTRLPDVVATVGDDLGRRQVGGRCDPFARVGSVRTWTEHRVALLAQMVRPERYDKRLVGATRYPRYSLVRSQVLRWVLSDQLRSLSSRQQKIGESFLEIRLANKIVFDRIWIIYFFG